MNGQRRQVVDIFTYLGSASSRVMHIEAEVTARTAEIQKSIWPTSRHCLGVEWNQT